MLVSLIHPARKTNGSAPVDMSGTPSIWARVAPPACTSGLKLSAYRAVEGRRIRTGIRTESVNTMKLITCPNLRMSRM
jgi:hypothetical protein